MRVRAQESSPYTYGCFRFSGTAETDNLGYHLAYHLAEHLTYHLADDLANHLAHHLAWLQLWTIWPTAHHLAHYPLNVWTSLWGRLGRAEISAKSSDHLALHVSGAFLVLFSSIWSRLRLSGRSGHLWK